MQQDQTTGAGAPMPSAHSLYDTDGLGKRICKTGNAIYLLMSRIRRGLAPAGALPRPLDLPGRRLLWDELSVQRWIDAHRVPTRGRPTKTAQIAKRDAFPAQAAGVQS